MSGPFGSSQWMYSSGGGFYPHTIDQSLRFNDGDNAYLSRSFSTGDSRTTWTLSLWFKLGDLTSREDLFSTALLGYNEAFLAVEPNGRLRFYDYDNSIANYRARLEPAGRLRDPSAWYHVVITFDTTNATSSERARMYINGVRQTTFDFETYPAQNYQGFVNAASTYYIGRTTYGSYLDGYLAEVNFVDGYAQQPTDFGEFKSGVWIPKKYSSSYGTNGFYLKFANSGSLGADTSGNGNNWTANNLAATDQMLDSPTNNFATMNSLSGYTYTSNISNSLSEGSLQIAQTAATYGGRASTFAVPRTGKWYVECYAKSAVGAGDNAAFGMHTPDGNNVYNYDGYYLGSGIINKKTDGSASSTQGVGAVSTGDIMSITIDADARTAQIKRNNVNVSTSYTMTSSEVDYFITYVGWEHTGGGYIYNFGQDSSFAGHKTAQGNTDANGYGDFFYAPPSGYLSLCSANLSVAEAVDPAEDNSPQDYFNTVLYNGTSSTQNITGVGFQPDLVWVKRRDADQSAHCVTDIIRGGGIVLNPTFNYADQNYANAAPYNFASDGFSVSTDDVWWNRSGANYVSWNWLASNTTASNTSGSISSTVSVSTGAGFSIVSWTGTGSSSTVGHGLSSTPELIINKNRSAAENWVVYSIAQPNGTQYLRLNSDGALVSDSSVFGAAPTSSVFTVGSNPEGNGNGNNHIAYCFHSVDGFSKVGTYVGNSSADGPFVYTGFKVAWLLVKRVTYSQEWTIFDDVRSEYNPALKELYPAQPWAEGTDSAGVDLLSNGFKPRRYSDYLNNSNSTYLYYAVAENPFKYANAR